MAIRWSYNGMRVDLYENGPSNQDMSNYEMVASYKAGNGLVFVITLEMALYRKQGRNLISGVIQYIQRYGLSGAKFNVSPQSTFFKSTNAKFSRK